jgi:hypothetical protein
MANLLKGSLTYGAGVATDAHRRHQHQTANPPTGPGRAIARAEGRSMDLLLFDSFSGTCPVRAVHERQGGARIHAAGGARPRAAMREVGFAMSPVDAAASFIVPSTSKEAEVRAFGRGSGESRGKSPRRRSVKKDVRP